MNIYTFLRRFASELVTLQRVPAVGSYVRLDEVDGRRL